MEPRIQYAQTTDGVSIAFFTLGEGEPLVYASNVWGDLHWYTHNDATRKSVDALVASGLRVVRYDARGMGASDRDVTDFSLDARLRDLEAVIDHVGIERFVLCGYGQGGPAAITYSLRYPQRVSHLVLVNSFASGYGYYENIPAMRALIGLRSMVEEQWEFFTLTLASGVTRFKDTAHARKTAELFRSSMSPNAFLSFVNADEKIDVMDILPLLGVATLVVQDTSGFQTQDLSRVLASRIPGACFVATDDYIQELHSFVLGRPMERHLIAPAPDLPAGTAIILFADIVDSTSLTEQLGDAAFRDRARELDTSLRKVIRESGGTPVEGKLVGDGVLAVFTSARQAIECALRCNAAGESVELQLHLGIHAGDVIREEDPDGRANVYGGAVNIAARIAGASAPGEVLVSDTVRGLARTSAGVAFDDRGEQALKGIDEAQRLYAVRGGGDD